MHENIVITGSSGFIAKALIKRLDKKKFHFKHILEKKMIIQFLLVIMGT